MTAERAAKNLPRILVVDAELPIRRFLHTTLSREEFYLYEAENGHAGLAAAVAVRPNMILLGLGLPDLDGLEFIKQFREWSQVPIIVLSERQREDDKVSALDSGADDYLTKPFGISELLARIRAVLRRSLQQIPESLFSCNDLKIDFDRRLVLVNSEEIHLTPIEYDILCLLAAHADRVVTHHQLLMQIWGSVTPEHAHILRVNISNLRRKIEANTSHPRHIITVTGVGYRLKTRGDRNGDEIR
ncbi:MAG: winged helix-turn-helix domain-containing protein [Desulfuromonadales bacterium]|nr:winged helix-turn-helix domain-containing protein [Desulfuromonadales bacterium]